jgi:hypothetical protein
MRRTTAVGADQKEIIASRFDAKVLTDQGFVPSKRRCSRNWRCRLARGLVGRADRRPHQVGDNGSTSIGDHHHLQTVVQGEVPRHSAPKRATLRPGAGPTRPRALMSLQRPALAAKEWRDASEHLLQGLTPCSGLLLWSSGRRGLTLLKRRGRSCWLLLLLRLLCFPVAALLTLGHGALPGCPDRRMVGDTV